MAGSSGPFVMKWDQPCQCQQGLRLHCTCCVTDVLFGLIAVFEFQATHDLVYYFRSQVQATCCDWVGCNVILLPLFVVCMALGTGLTQS